MPALQDLCTILVQPAIERSHRIRRGMSVFWGEFHPPILVRCKAMKNYGEVMKANVVGWVLSGFGLFLLIMNVAFLNNPVRLLIAGESAQGVVVDRVYSTNPKSRYSETPMVEFAMSTGERVRVKGRVYSSSSSMRVGDAVTVAYSPSQPENARLLLFGEFVFEAFFLGVAGIFLLGWILLPGSEKKYWISVPGGQKDLKTSGFPAVASVLDADSKTGILKYRIDKETRVPDNQIRSENVDNFISLENTVYDWKPSKTDAAMKKGDQYRAYLGALKPTEDFYVDFSDKIGYDPFVTSNDEDYIDDEEIENKLIGKLKKLATKSLPYLSQESSSEILKLIEDEELILAFEKLMNGIMNLPKPLPVPFQRVDWDDCLEIAAYLEAEYDSEFWTKFETFEKGRK